MKLSDPVRRIIHNSVRWSGLLKLADRVMSRSLVVLTYHRVLPDEECADYPFPSLAMPASVFRSQVRWLADHCEVLPLAGAVERHLASDQERSQPMVAMTFDDGYADNFTAAEVLEEVGIRGTFFVVSDFIRSRSQLWFDRAAFAWKDASLAARAEVCLHFGAEPCASVHEYVQQLKRLHPTLRDETIARLERSHSRATSSNGHDASPSFEPMSREQIIDLHRRGHEIGSHTVSHPMLPLLREPELERELLESRRVLEAMLGAEVKSISYPNGDFNERVRQRTERAGYRYAVTTARGLNRGRVDRLALRRIAPSPRTARSADQLDRSFRLDIAKAIFGSQPEGSGKSAGGSIAYLNSQYPTLSHTFIEREICALRREGVRIVPFSVRPAGREDRVGEAHARAANETTVLFDSPWRLARRAALQMIAHPVRAIEAIATSQRVSPSGLRARLRHLGYVFESARLAREMRLAGLRHVHVHMANNGAMIARLACIHEPSIQYSLTIHGSAEFFHIDSWTLAAKVEAATFVRCISDYCRAQIMAWTDPKAWKHFHIVRCGIDPGDTPVRLRQSPKNVAKPLRLVTVGRLHPIKGYAVLLRACSTLCRSGVDWSLDIVGDGPERSDLEALAQELGIRERVRFHGPVAAEDVARHYDAADVMVLSSFMEGVPIVLMEAMARGLPVIATRVGGIPELVDDGVSGFLVAPGSASELAGAIGELAKDVERRVEMGRVGRGRVQREYDQQRLGCEMFELFRRYELAETADVPAAAPAHDKSVSRPAVPGPHVKPNYAIISPCRDEAEHMRETLESVLAQTVRPDLWLIVDDGSTDHTSAILTEYVRRYDFIRVIRLADRGERRVGPGVIDAFNAGLEAIDLAGFDYLCKLDLDLRLPPRYFEMLIAQMEADVRIGTCSGKPYFINGRGRLVSERIGDDVSAGMTKLYRVECFQQIGGFVREVMWDGIDCHRCRMLGWTVRSWDDPDLRFIHLRPMGSSQKSIWNGRFRHGYGQWFMGTTLPYMAASALFRMSRPPVFLGGLAMLSGYLWAMIRRLPRYPDAEFRRFLRSFQWAALLHGKDYAMKAVEARMQHRVLRSVRGTIQQRDPRSANGTARSEERARIGEPAYGEDHLPRRSLQTAMHSFSERKDCT